MKKNILYTISIFTLIIVIILIAFESLAWFTGVYKEDAEIDGIVNGAYFAGGDGTEDNPYLISNYRHLRNLALLQNNGKFNKDSDNDGTPDEIYHFAIKDGVTELNVSSVWIPPIGTKDNPFYGTFNGNVLDYKDGKYVFCEIKGLRVSTDTKRTNTKLGPENYNDVGFFGYVKSAAGSIGCFTLSDVYIERYGETSSNTNYTGIIAGNVEKQDAIQFVGVYTARLSYRDTIESTSKTSLIGNIKLLEQDQTSSGDGTGSGDNNRFGASIDFASFYERIDNIYDAYVYVNGVEKGGSTPVYNVTGFDKYTNSYTTDGFTNFNGPFYIPLKIEKPTDSDKNILTGDALNEYYIYGGGTAEKPGDYIETVAENNPGYIIGSSSDSVSIASKTLEGVLQSNWFTTSNNVVTTVEEPTTYTVDNLIFHTSRVHGMAENKYTENADDYYSNSGRYKTVKNDVVALFQNSSNRVFGIKFDAGMDNNNEVTTNGISIYNQTYDSYIDNSGNTISGKYPMPVNCLIFTGEVDGVAAVAAISWDNQSNLFNIYEIERYSQEKNGIFYNMKQITSVYSLSSIDDNNNNETKTYYYGYDNANPTNYTSDMQLEYSHQWTYGLIKDCLWYFEIPIKAGVEYAISRHTNGNAAYIVYMDIGLSAGDDSSTTEKPKLYYVQFVDFIKEGITITTNEEDWTSIHTYVILEVLNSTSDGVELISYKGKDDKKVGYKTNNSNLTVKETHDPNNNSEVDDSLDTNDIEPPTT